MDWATQNILGGMFVLDRFSAFMKILILFGLMGALAISVRFLQQETIFRFEYPVLILLAGLGMMGMVSANNLLSLYMSLELQSLSLYVLAAFHRNSLQSSEAAIKYFVLGALSSGMILFGSSLLYGFSGSLDFGVIRASAAAFEIMPPGFTIGMVFLLAGLAFKISAVPFHMWTPDVYQGAPTSVTALFAMVPKLAAFGLLMRVLFVPFDAAEGQWVQILYFLSGASMVLGAFAGLAQDNIKRLLAYSSIGNMGYALLGLMSGTAGGAAAVVLYLLVYLFMTAGAFTVLLTLRRGGCEASNIRDLSGLVRYNPALAYAMAAIMFSMSGIPPMAGFFGKFFIFNDAIAAGQYGLAVIGVLSSVVAAYYYLRVIKVMFFDEAHDPLETAMPLEGKIVLFVSVALAAGFILCPGCFLQSARMAVSSLF
jgi:NADH-quinone oxidoreductase subunit N